MCTTNPQLRNVGNYGDVLKHAALITFAEDLLIYGRKRFAYIETHAFMLEAPCPNPEQWKKEISAPTRRPLYRNYIYAEKQVLDGLPYRCSAGLIINVLRNMHLRSSNAVDPIIILAEKDDATREVLKSQLNKELVTNCTVLEDAEELDSITLPDDIRTILILVDPFVLDADTWNDIATAVGKLVKVGMTVLLELFTFDKKRAKVKWPSPPAGMLGPVNVMHRKPYHLAVYSTEDFIARRVRFRCSAYLGWDFVNKSKIGGYKKKVI
jgi:hypothetical protein